MRNLGDKILKWTGMGMIAVGGFVILVFGIGGMFLCAASSADAGCGYQAVSWALGGWAFAVCGLIPLLVRVLFYFDF